MLWNQACFLLLMNKIIKMAVLDFKKFTSLNNNNMPFKQMDQTLTLKILLNTIINCRTIHAVEDSSKFNNTVHCARVALLVFIKHIITRE